MAMADALPIEPAPTRTRFALDALNFFLADVRDGLGPYLAVYLLTIQHWDEERIGIVMSMAGMAVASLISVLRVPTRAIDHDRARGLHDGGADHDQPSGFRVLLTCRP